MVSKKVKNAIERTKKVSEVTGITFKEVWRSLYADLTEGDEINITLDDLLYLIKILPTFGTRISIRTRAMGKLCKRLEDFGRFPADFFKNNESYYSHDTDDYCNIVHKEIQKRTTIAQLVKLESAIKGQAYFKKLVESNLDVNCFVDKWIALKMRKLSEEEVRNEISKASSITRLGTLVSKLDGSKSHLRDVALKKLASLIPVE